MVKKFYKVVIILIIVALYIAGCATQDTKKTGISDNTVHGTVTIKPFRSYEECIELRPGFVFDYEFDSSDSVNFNIHYHAEDGVHNPVNKAGVRWGKGTIDPTSHYFYTEEQENYCLMWDNFNSEPIRLSFTCIIRKK
jgi:predicted small secreted protein